MLAWAVSVKIMKPYHVIVVHDKYCNKWFMSKVSRNVCRTNSKYKLKNLTQDVSVIQEYEDIDLHSLSHK